MKFEDLKLMSIGCNCTMIGCIDKEKRIKGPVDNVNTKSLSGLKLTIENKIYQYIKTTTPICVEKKPGEYRQGDITTIYKFADKFDFLHNAPTSDKFFKEFKMRCDRLVKFILSINSDEQKWLTLSLNAFLVKWGTGECIKNNLKEVLLYLKEKNLLNKTIIIGTKLNKSAYKVFNYFLPNATIKKLQQELRITINYIEIIDLDRDHLAPVKQQFKEKVTKLVNYLSQKKTNDYLNYTGYYGL